MTNLTDELLREDLAEVMSMLTAREKAILRLRFGLEDGKTRTYKEIAGIMGVSHERVRQLEAQALRKLRNPKK